MKSNELGGIFVLRNYLFRQKVLEALAFLTKKNIGAMAHDWISYRKKK